MEAFLINIALQDMVLRQADGVEIAGEDLRQAVILSRQAGELVSVLAQRWLPSGDWVLSQAATLGILRPVNGDDAGLAESFAARLNMLESRPNCSWSVEIGDDEVIARDRVRGVENEWRLSATLLGSSESMQLNRMSEKLREKFEKTAELRFRGNSDMVAEAGELFQLVLQHARKGLAIQRYKGLGEMNPDQLWETTLDPEFRTLLQVRVNHEDEADQLFSTLMGDVVEPRRDFIQTHALQVVNLDV